MSVEDSKMDLQNAATSIFVEKDNEGDRLWQNFTILRDKAPVYFFEQADSWIVTGYKEIRSLLMSGSAKISWDARNDALTPDWRTHTARAHMREWFGHKDGSAHAEIRVPLNEFFLPKAMEAFRPRVTEIVHEILTEFRDRRGGDFVRDVSYALTTKLTARFLDLPEVNRPEFKPLIVSMMSAFEFDLTTEEWKAADTAAATLRQFWAEEVRRRIADPVGDDMISELIRRKIFTEHQVVVIAENMLNAAFESTANTSANGLCALLQNPDQLALARQSAAARAAIPDEVLRLVSAAPVTVRRTEAPVSVGDATIPAGETVMIALGAANRDPRAFPDPDRFDLQRAGSRPIPFGHGIHVCIGQWMARLALTELYEQIVTSWNRIEIDGPAPCMHGLSIRHLRQLPLHVA